MKFEFLNQLPLGVGISGLGHGFGDDKLDNKSLLEKHQIRLKPSFIDRSIGIESRFFLSQQQTTSDMAVKAAQMALDNAGLTVDDISRLILATSSPDHQTPSTACIVQHKLGGKGFAAVDINAACSGFIYAMDMAARAVATGDKHVLVIGADARSRDLNMQDKRTAFLYGDGAGAAIVSSVDKSEGGLLNSVTYADGIGWDAVYIPAGGSKMPATEEVVRDNLHKLSMPDGGRVATNAKEGFASLCDQVFEGTPYSRDDADFYIFHQPNQRLLEGIAEALAIPAEKTYFNFNQYGNTVAGSIPIALSEAHQAGKIKKGDLVVLCGVGGGFTGGAHLIRWNY